MSKRRAPGSGLKGIELIKAIWTPEELERLSQEEELQVGVGDCAEAPCHTESEGREPLGE